MTASGRRPRQVPRRPDQPRPGQVGPNLVEPDDSRPADSGTTLELPYRPPFDWQRLLAFLSTRAINGIEVCGRVNPNAGAEAAKPMKLRADLSNMHLIDDSTGKVL